ncbi:MAG: hypothetical protein ACI4VB_03885 [Bradymonadia bacterium]
MAFIVVAEMRRLVVNFIVDVGHGISADPSGTSSFPGITIISVTYRWCLTACFCHF